MYKKISKLVNNFNLPFDFYDSSSPDWPKLILFPFFQPYVELLNHRISDLIIIIYLFI